MKTCLICGETKPLEDFVRASRNPDGHGPYCKSCHNSRQRQTYAERRRDGTHTRPKQHTPFPFVRELTAQGFHCLLCGKPFGEYADYMVYHGGAVHHWTPRSMEKCGECVPEGFVCKACGRRLAADGP